MLKYPCGTYNGKFPFGWILALHISLSRYKPGILSSDIIHVLLLVGLCMGYYSSGMLSLVKSNSLAFIRGKEEE